MPANDPGPDDGGGAVSVAAYSVGLRRYVLAMLVTVSVISYIDRQILTILLEAIKRDLHLSDTQIGLLTGVFFSAFFIISGIPLARAADTGRRSTIIAACIGAWSAATMFCGMAGNYIHLAIGRMLVAVGEAGSAPASYSLLADLFPPRWRTRVFALIGCGSSIGIAFGVFLGGELLENFTWRQVFLVVGAPGVLFAILFWLTVPEPARPPDRTGMARVSWLRALIGFLRIKTYRRLVALTIFAALTAYAMLAWMPTFLIRVHGMSPGDVGRTMGPAVAIGLLMGNLTAGILADKLGRHDRRWLIWTAGLGPMISVPIGLASLAWPTAIGAVIWFAFFNLFTGFWSAPVVNVVVGLVGSQTRALAAATISILASVGGAIGPLFVGVVSDIFAPQLGVDALRYALMAVLAGCMAAGFSALLAGRSLMADFRDDAA